MKTPFRRRHPSSALPLLPWVPRTLALLLLISPPAVQAGFQPMQEADRILGSQLLPPGRMSDITHIAFDEAHAKAYFIDAAGDRVLRFAMTEALQPTGLAEAVFGQPDFESEGPQAPLSANIYQAGGICVDSDGRLWVADSNHNRVLRFDHAWDKPSFSPANGVLGQTTLSSETSGTSASKMDRPQSVAVDGNGNLYVADSANNRVLRFNNAANRSNGAAADAVFGQINFGNKLAATTAASMSFPLSIAIEPMASPGHWRLWVSDTGNNRLLRFEEAATVGSGASASGVLGQPNFTTSSAGITASKLDSPYDIALWQGHLWVSESSSHRVLHYQAAWFQPNGAAATSVLGQPNFTSHASGSGASGLNVPKGLGVENGHLWVADTNNSRVVRWANAAAKANGASANGVLGQSALIQDPAKKINPSALAIDPVSGKLFVSDPDRNRVLRFADQQSLASDAAAEAVFGQINFLNSGTGASAAAMKDPRGLWVDGGGRLWVADNGNNRVLRFDAASTEGSGASADRVLGQSGFNSSLAATTATGMEGPTSVCVDAAGHLWVVDSGNYRVLRFASAVTKATGSAANSVLGQPNFTSGGQPAAASATTFGAPHSVFPGPDGRLWVTDRLRGRVLRFDGAAAKANGAAANGVVGQPNFTETGAGSSATELGNPLGIALTGGGSLWIADQYNARLSCFSPPAAAANGAEATSLLGQESWDAIVRGSSASQFNPTSVAIAPDGGLWVADQVFPGITGRVMHFAPAPLAITASGLNAQGKFFLSFDSTEGVKYNVRVSIDLKAWSLAGLVTATGSETTYTYPLSPTDNRFFRVEEP